MKIILGFLAIVFMIVFILGPIGCTRADRAQVTSLGSRFKITLYGCDGKPIREWRSSGKVSAEDQSDGWYFSEAGTNLLIRVSGSVAVEELP